MHAMASIFTFVLALATTVVALPTAEQVYPEVIPSPGLPSLASLNLTSAELYQMERPTFFAIQSTQYNLKCGPDDYAYVDVQDIIACYHYLANLGHQQCKVSGDISDYQRFCTAGQGDIGGSSITGKPESSYCSDVATSALGVINGCTRSDQTVAGSNAANGNGNLVVACFNQ